MLPSVIVSIGEERKVLQSVHDFGAFSVYDFGVHPASPLAVHRVPEVLHL